MKDYKTKLTELIEDLNSLPLHYCSEELRGKFKVRSTLKSSEDFDDIIFTRILFEDVETLNILTMEDYITSKQEHWHRLYNEFLRWLIFAQDTRNWQLKDSQGNIIVSIPIRKLFKEGYGR